MKKALIAVASATLASLGSNAAVVLNVNVSDPANLVITATGAASSISDTALLASGVTLKDFFTATMSQFGSFAGNLSVVGSGFPFDNWSFDSTIGTGLNLYSTQGTTYSVTLGVSPFSGEGSTDFTAWVASLPVSGATGDVLIGESSAGANIIGQWVAVPEPSSYGIAAGVALIAFAAQRRFRNH